MKADVQNPIGQIGEQRVQRMAEPGAAQHVLEWLPIECVAHRVGGGIGELVESLVSTQTFDRVCDGLTDVHCRQHARLSDRAKPVHGSQVWQPGTSGACEH